MRELAVTAEAELVDHMTKVVVFVATATQIRHEFIAEECVVLERAARAQVQVANHLVEVQHTRNVAALVVLSLDTLLPALLHTLLHLMGRMEGPPRVGVRLTNIVARVTAARLGRRGAIA